MMEHSGIYDDYSPDNYACVKITKSINLVGEDKYTTIIDRNGLHDAIKVKADDVIVKGFTIQNAGTPESTRHGAGLRLYSYTNIMIEDNNIINCYRGVWVTSGEGEIFIQNNNFSKNYWSIEISKGSTSVEVYENIFSNNNIGIIKSGKTCIFEKNHFSENEIGILLRNAESTLISNNFFNGNEIGIQSEDKTKSTITQNNFINNDRHATISRCSTILETPFFFSFRNKWIKNYWDHWISLIPRPITGNWIIMLRIFPSPMTIPIAIFPFFEFDWHPAKEPYNIP